MDKGAPGAPFRCVPGAFVCWFYAVVVIAMHASASDNDVHSERLTKVWKKARLARLFALFLTRFPVAFMQLS